MNLELLKNNNKEGGLSAKSTELFPNRAVITIKPQNKDGKKKVSTLHLNNTAMSTLGISKENNNIIVFDKYIVSDVDEEERTAMVLFTTDEKVFKLDKQYKAYRVSLGSHNCMSSEIYGKLVSKFNLDTTKINYVELVPTIERTGGAYTFKLIEPEVKEVQIEFNKSEDLEIETVQH